LLAAKLDSLELRGRMLEASLLSGLAISQTRTALAHAISYPLTAHLGVPHGLACGFTLPALLAFNSKEDDGRLLALARQLGFSEIDAFHEGLDELLARLEVPAMMRRYVSSRAAALAFVPEMFTPGRSNNNLRTASASDVEGLLEASLP
jgi:alcohol dehydrogenase